MRKSALLFMQSSKPITGYDNVSYEVSTIVPDQYGYGYFVPLRNVHFTQQSGLHGGTVTWRNVSGYELYDGAGNWIADGNVFDSYPAYPLGNSWGRIYQIVQPTYTSWASTGNLGFETVTEYNDLLLQMDNTTKRNLRGTRLY